MPAPLIRPMHRPAAPRRRRAPLAAALLALGLTACEDVVVPEQDPANLTFATSLGVNLAGSTRTPSGLYYQDVITGGGIPAESLYTVSVYYRGALANGRQFDARASSTGQPFVFVLGTGSVIRGWDEGLKGMRIGGRRRLVIPPRLGYGNRTNGTIPAGSVLVFDVDMVNAVRPVTTTPSTSVGGR